MTDEENKASDSYPFGVQPPGVAELAQRPEGAYVPRTMEERTAEEAQLPPITLPARAPHPGRPRRRTWVDNDGDVWHEIKFGTGRVEGIQDGQVARLRFSDVEERYGPLIELDSVNMTTAAENAIDQMHAACITFLHQEALREDDEALRKRLVKAAEDINGWKR